MPEAAVGSAAFALEIVDAHDLAVQRCGLVAEQALRPSIAARGIVEVTVFGHCERHIRLK